MKVFVAVLLATIAVATASQEAIDWTKVRPIYEVSETLASFMKRFPFNSAPGSLSSRIVGGNEAIPHSIPYQVALLLDTGAGSAFCGGSIISQNAVLTAAHCAEVVCLGCSVTVIAGAHNVQEEEPEQVRQQSSNIIIHSEWTPSLLRNDVALIILPLSLEYNDNIQPIRLPSRSDASQTFVNEITLASGWGKPSDSATGISPVLRYVRSNVISKLSCNIQYFGVIQDSNICTSGSGGKSTCNGDSGGPLVHDETDGRPTQLGIVSFGIAFGCEVGWPAVFARVSSYLDWISAETGVVIRE